MQKKSNLNFCAAFFTLLFASALFLGGNVGGAEELEALPGKRALEKRSFRPPNFETPIELLDKDFTPNKSFFVRSHLPNIPKINLASWRLEVAGEAVEKPMSFSFEQLTKDFPQVELNAILLCSGNRRALFNPRVQGVQWKNGAVGNAKWRGVRLKDVLQKAGLKPEAVEVVFDGADSPSLPQTPDFQKSIPITKALDEDTIIAFRMNGSELPQHQGFPARLIVPGWTATYWIKQLSSIRVVNKPFEGFWMKTAYRIPKGKFKEVETAWKGQETEVNTPVTEIAVNSLITSPRPGQRFRVGEVITVHGYAWDSGKGIDGVEVSLDQGKTWVAAQMGKDYGKYSWRPFTYQSKLGETREYSVMSRATNHAGQTQSPVLIANPAGYHHNVPQPVTFFADTNKKTSKGKSENRPRTIAAKESYELVDAPGRDLVIAKCISCHSAEYIPMNGGFLDQKGWEAVVLKMKKVMGAPIEENEIPLLVSYLTKNYGKPVSGDQK